MDLQLVLTTTGAVRRYAAEPLRDQDLHRILDLARFAPSGGNRQAWRVIVVRSADTRRALVELARPTFRLYKAQVSAGEAPWNTVDPSSIDAETAPEPTDSSTLESQLDAPVMLVVAIDLARVASFDRHLERVGLVSGASVYPFVWNILLAARSLGYGGTLSTFVTAAEPAVRQLVHLPSRYAVAAVVALGVPERQVSRLSRKAVSDFTTIDHFDGEPFEQPSTLRGSSGQGDL